MTTKLFRLIVGLCPLGGGCGPLLNTARHSIIEPIEYCRPLNDISDRVRFHSLANSAWKTFAKAEPKHSYSSDYSDGFKKGYVDYLFAGGSGTPPPVPPRSYWNSWYETPEGYLAVQEWFAGYEQGVAAAEESGRRNFVPVPSTTSPVEVVPSHVQEP